MGVLTRGTEARGVQTSYHLDFYQKRNDRLRLIFSLKPMEVKWRSLSNVRLFVTLWTIQFMEFSRPEYFSRESSQPVIKPRSPALQADSFPVEPQGKPKNTGVSSLSLLQWIFPTQESNQGLLHCRWILYQLSYQASPLNLCRKD